MFNAYKYIFMAFLKCLIADVMHHMRHYLIQIHYFVSSLHAAISWTYANLVHQRDNVLPYYNSF